MNEIFKQQLADECATDIKLVLGLQEFDRKMREEVEKIIRYAIACGIEDEFERLYKLSSNELKHEFDEYERNIS